MHSSGKSGNLVVLKEDGWSGSMGSIDLSDSLTPGLDTDRLPEHQSRPVLLR